MRSLSARLLALLTIALLPLGLIAVYQTVKVMREALEIADSEILGRTAQAARDEILLIKRAHGFALTLGTSAAFLDANPFQCQLVMKRFVEQNPQFIFARFISSDGVMRCSSDGKEFDFASTDDWLEFVDQPRRTVVFHQGGAAAGMPLIVASVPVFADDGTLAGRGSVAFPRGVFDELLGTDIPNLDVAIINREGSIISASDASLEMSFKKLDLRPEALDVPRDGLTLRTEIDEGPVAITVIPIVPKESYLVGQWSQTLEPFSVSMLGMATPAFPMIMWLVSLVVAFLAIERLVLRHLRTMRRGMADFSSNDLSGSYLQLGDAPSEIGEIAANYNQMIDRIAADHNDLEQSVREKDLLLKEVHHRVKNNLQLIASILNMQLRQIAAPQAKAVLRRVQDRVMSLAIIHRALYTDADLGTVRVDQLLQDIVNESLNVSERPGSNLETDISFAPIELDPDQTVPLSLLVTEAVTNAVKYMEFNAEQPARLSIQLTEPEPYMIELVVENSRGPGTDDESEGTGLGARLIEAFVQQLDGELTVDETADAYRVHVCFPKLGYKRVGSESA